MRGVQALPSQQRAEVLQASASRTIVRLSSTVKRRRAAFAATSISGPFKVRSGALISLRSLLALDTELQGVTVSLMLAERGVPVWRFQRADRSKMTDPGGALRMATVGTMPLLAAGTADSVPVGTRRIDQDGPTCCL